MFYPHPIYKKNITIVAKTNDITGKYAWRIYLKAKDKICTRASISYLKSEYLPSRLYSKERALYFANEMAKEWGEKYLKIFGDNIKKKI